MRKKSISLIVVLTFLMTLFPLALPAFAADYTRIGSVITVSDDDVSKLNRVRAEFSVGELVYDDEAIISLPSGFEFRKGLDGDDADTQQPIEDWTNGTGPNQITIEDSNDLKLEVTYRDDNKIKVRVVEAPEEGAEPMLFIDLGAVYVDKGFEGDIPLKIDGTPGSGFDDAEVIVGRVSDGAVEVEVTDSETFSDNGDVTIEVTEDQKGAFEEGDSVKFILPDGLAWSIVDGDNVIYGDIKHDEDFEWAVEDDELILKIKDGAAWSKASSLEIKARITVEDETEVDVGDIVAKVKGESDVTPSTVVVGAYGEYAFNVTADDPETVYAGQTEQEIADFTIEEDIEGTFVNNRTLTLTLPDWAVWGALPDVVDDEINLNLISFPGKDGHTAKYQVEGTSDSAAELEFTDMEICLSPEAPEGDLVIELGGTCGIDEEVTVATVKKPITMETTDSPTIVIGRSGQGIAEITLTEAEEGIIREGVGSLIVSLPKDVEWDEYDVEVVEGDLEIGDVDAEDEYLFIEIDDESNDISKIKITGSIVAYRTVPEGSVTAEIWGLPVIAVHDFDALEDQYGDGKLSSDGYWLIDGAAGDLEAVEADDFDIFDIDASEWEGIIFADDGPAAEGEVAFVGTPAPSEQQIKAVFTLGSTTFTLNGVEQTMDVAPYAKNGRTYLPMRYVAKALGIKDSGILWKAGTATFISGNKVVSVKVGSSVMTINGAPVSMDVAPEIVSGRVMIPIKWIATAFDVDVAWDAATQQVTVE